MAALLVSLAVMSVVMSELLPVWRHQAQREKEAELAFRGEQYARAIYLYQAKFRIAPPSIDVLVQQRFLRKKYKDPMTEDGEFQLLYVGSNPQPGIPPTGQAGAIGTQPGVAAPSGTRAGTGSSTIGSSPGSVGATVGGRPVAAGGIMGVVSKSKEASIRIYRGATHYNEWRFFYNAQGRGGPAQRGKPGIGPGGQPLPGRPGLPGGRGRGRGGRGRSPGQDRGIGPGRRIGPGGFGARPPIIRPPGR
jgi:type II secretory pathway pseudopilin PulG